MGDPRIPHSEYLSQIILAIPFITSPMQPSWIALTPAGSELSHLCKTPQTFISISPKAFSTSCLVLWLFVHHISLTNPVYPSAHLESQRHQVQTSQTSSCSHVPRGHCPPLSCETRGLVIPGASFPSILRHFSEFGFFFFLISKLSLDPSSCQHLCDPRACRLLPGLLSNLPAHFPEALAALSLTPVGVIDMNSKSDPDLIMTPSPQSPLSPSYG